MPVVVFQKNNISRASLFVLIPKTGGSALVSFFQMIGGKLFLHNENKFILDSMKCPTQHFHYDLLNKFLNIEEFSFSFAVVRNPISRAKSDYLWSYRNSPDLSRIPNFEEWFTHKLEKYADNSYILDNHIRPQSEFVGEGIKKFYRYEDGLESIAEDVLSNMSIRINMKEEQNFVPLVNTAAQNSKRNIKSDDVEVSSDAMGLLMEFYKEDFERFYPTF